MAKRYVGDAVVRITYHDSGDYRGTVSVPGYVWRFADLKAPPAMTLASDSSAAYDKMACAAVSFGSDPESNGNRECADAIGQATMCDMDDQGNYNVSRRKPLTHREDNVCPGHESTDGPMGISTYCDGSCRK